MPDMMNDIGREVAGKVEEENTSPGIRWGIWWIALTANRRGSTTLLERTNVQQGDPLGEAGWEPPYGQKAK